MRCERYRAFWGLLVISVGPNLLHALLAVGFARKQAYSSERVAIGRNRYRLTVALSGKRNPLQALLAIASFLIYNTAWDRRVKRTPVFFKADQSAACVACGCGIRGVFYRLPGSSGRCVLF